MPKPFRSVKDQTATDDVHDWKAPKANGRLNGAKGKLVPAVAGE